MVVDHFRQVYDVVLYIGIIDILQKYNMRKKVEHAYKSVKYNPLSISVVEPGFYSKRFLNFIRTVFPENTPTNNSFIFPSFSPERTNFGENLAARLSKSLLGKYELSISGRVAMFCIIGCLQACRSSGSNLPCKLQVY